MRIGRYVLLGIGLAAVLALAAACGEDEGEGDASPTAARTTPTAAATSATQYPLTLTDMLGRSVTLSAAPKKVAALSPTTVEFVYAVGGTSVTRSSSVRFPEAATSAKDIGPSYQPNLELIAAEGPDLILADSILQPQLKDALEGLGKPVLYAGAGTYQDVLTGLRLVGKALDRPAAAEDAASAIEKTLADLQAKVPAAKPKVLVLNGTPDDFYAAKPESYVGDLVALLQGDNVAKGQPDVGRFPGYTKLSLESIVAAQPEVVLAITAGPPGAATISSSLAGNAAWAGVPAVKSGRVSEISADLYLMSPGPRAGLALETLAKLLYPDAFGT